MSQQVPTFSPLDLRSFLDDAMQADYYQQINKPVDVHTQIAALCSQVKKPTLFTNLTGYEDFRLVDGLTRFRQGQALALNIEHRPETVIPTYLERLCLGPGQTHEVTHAPIKDTIWRGKDANLYRLPIPVPSEGEDFPHLGIQQEDFLVPTISGGMGITRHPDGTHNTFFTMAKVIGEQRIQFFMLPGHTAQNVQAWAERGERCPMALVIGCHPIYELGAVYSGPHKGFSELNMVSALLGGDAVPTIKAETLDLNIPAYAEIVIEGFIDPEKAPYLHASSHSDSYAPIISMEPFFDVTAITLREKPIYRHIQPNRFTEHHALAEFITIPPMFKAMLDKRLPVKDIHMPLQSCGNCAIIQMTANNPAEVREAMATALANPIAPRLSIIVDEDVDIYDSSDLLFALSIRTNGTFDIEGFNGTRGLPEPLTVQINSATDIQMRANNKWAIDATKPSLAEPDHRLENVRLKARGENSGVTLADFI